MMFLLDDAVACYMMGQPVYKYEVDEYGFIHKNTTTTRNHSSYYTESLLPSSYRNKPVAAHGGMSTQGFYQHDTFMYMDVEAGISVAQSFEAETMLLESSLSLAVLQWLYSE